MSQQTTTTTTSASAWPKQLCQGSCILSIVLLVLHLSSVWSLGTYLAAVVTLILLYWSYDPRKERRAAAAAADADADIDTSEINNDRSAIIDRKLRKDNSLFHSLGVSSEDFLQFQSISDRFNNFLEIVNACRACQLEQFNTIIAIDYSASNEWQGRRTFNGKPLHKITNTPVSALIGSAASRSANPYQRVLAIMDHTLAHFIPSGGGVMAFGFGHDRGAGPDNAVFNMASESGIAQLSDKPHFSSYRDLLGAYNKIASSISLGGPTDMSAILRRVIDIVESANNAYHVLFIITDGQISANPQDTIDAIVDASDYPISIVVIGVGDGPFRDMYEFDDSLVRRKFDNFQFVDFHRVTAKAKNPEQAFALHCLMEIPDQYNSIRKQGYLPK